MTPLDLERSDGGSPLHRPANWHGVYGLCGHFPGQTECGWCRGLTNAEKLAHERRYLDGDR